MPDKPVASLRQPGGAETQAATSRPLSLDSDHRALPPHRSRKSPIRDNASTRLPRCTNRLSWTEYDASEQHANCLLDHMKWFHQQTGSMASENPKKGKEKQNSIQTDINIGKLKTFIAILSIWQVLDA
jgi:hypothetical protein